MYGLTAAKCRFDACEVTFRRPQSAVLTPAKVRLAARESTAHPMRDLFSLNRRLHFSFFTFHFSLFTLKPPSPSFLTSNRPHFRCTGRFSDDGVGLYPSHIPLIFKGIPLIKSTAPQHPNEKSMRLTVHKNGKRIRSDALQAFLKVLTFAYSFFYLIMQYELQCIKFPQ